MPRRPDLVIDSRLQTEFRGPTILHTYHEIDDHGRRSIRTENWKWDRTLGRGGFGHVELQALVTNNTSQTSLRAVKVIDKPQSTSRLVDCDRELEAIAKFSNERYKQWFVKSFGWFDNPESIFITMEYCSHGDLQHYLDSKQSIPVGEARVLIRQMLEGLDQMHRNDFAHRDFKPGNILIKKRPPSERWWIVLADFGISKRADENQESATAIKGTKTFMAPELLGFLNEPMPKSVDGFKAADMWALGQTTFYILSGRPAFSNPRELMDYCMGNLELPIGQLSMLAADNGRDFVARLMMALPTDRIDTIQSLNHHWMQSVVEDETNRQILESAEIDITFDAPASARWSALSVTRSFRRTKRDSHFDPLGKFQNLTQRIRARTERLESSSRATLRDTTKTVQMGESGNTVYPTVTSTASALETHSNAHLTFDTEEPFATSVTTVKRPSEEENVTSSDGHAHANMYDLAHDFPRTSLSTRELVEIKPTAKRIAAYMAVREHWATVDQGLSDWLTSVSSAESHEPYTESLRNDLESYFDRVTDSESDYGSYESYRKRTIPMLSGRL